VLESNLSEILPVNYKFIRGSTPTQSESDKTRSVERGVQGIPQVPGPDFSGGPKILEIPRTILKQRSKNGLI